MSFDWIVKIINFIGYGKEDWKGGHRVWTYPLRIRWERPRSTSCRWQSGTGFGKSIQDFRLKIRIFTDGNNLNVKLYEMTCCIHRLSACSSLFHGDVMFFPVPWQLGHVVFVIWKEFGANAGGTISICCGTAPAILDIWSWHIISVSIWNGKWESAYTVWSHLSMTSTNVPLSLPLIEYAWEFCTPNVLLASFGAFTLFTCIQKKETPKLVSDISRLSFGMYLIHIFFVIPITGFFVNGNPAEPIIPVWAAIPAATLISYVCCYLTCRLLSYIPGSKYIIGA